MKEDYKININKIDNFGGNLVKSFSLGSVGKEVLGTGPYEYYIYESNKDEKIAIDDLGSFTVFILFKPPEANVTSLEIKSPILEGDCIQVESEVLNLDISGGSIKLLIAGTKQSHPELKGVYLTRNKDIYKVEKPWGHELWLNKEHPLYVLKEIYIKNGTKTSLQYHNFKQETNVLFEGEALLHYKSAKDVENDEASAKDISQTQILPISSIDVEPRILHRLEALSDLLLYETSTPHLDDVVRISDDSNRGDGRVLEEHNS
jgi:hypothetical protein|tara:strand:- start:3218 stop:4000 length:783 start_codon:yes stop_codon:yes gene_type:complete